jgi:hypothetical protein
MKKKFRNKSIWGTTFLFIVNLYSSSFGTIIPIILNVLVLSFFFLSRQKISLLNKYQINTILFSLIIVGATLISSISNLHFSSYVWGRNIRITISLILFALIANNFLYKIKSKEIIISLIITLLINVIVVYIEMIFPSIKDFLYKIFDTEKELKELKFRAFGLFTSFDACGLSICVLMSILIALNNKIKKNVIIPLFIFSYLSIFFVSRTTMIVGSILLLIFIKVIYKKNKFLLYFVILPFLALVAYKAYYYLSNLINNNTIILNESYGDSYEVLTKKMLFFPENFYSLLIGTGESMASSDIGYVKIIFMSGITGLLLIIALYNYTLFDLKKFCNFEDSNKRIYNFFLLFYLLLLIYNYKLLLLYSRTCSDLYFLLIFSFEARYRYLYKRNNILNPTFKYA